MVAGERVDEIRRRSLVGTACQRRQVQRDGPALGPVDEAGDRVVVGIDAQLVQEQRRLSAVERQLGRSDLHDAPLHPEPAEGQRRGGSAGEHDAGAGGHLGDHHRQRVEHGATGELVDVVEDEDERAAAGGEHGAELLQRGRTDRR